MDVPLTALVDGEEVAWTERRWVVRSVAYANAQEEALERRLSQATEQLRQLAVRKQGKKRLSQEQLRQVAQDVLRERGVEGLLSVRVDSVVTKKEVRTYKDRPARVQEQQMLELQVQRDEEEIAKKKREMGWQVYATNALMLALSAVVCAYRGQYRVEDLWSRLKGKSLKLTPLYLQDETRIAGLVYLLSIALRVFTLVEWLVREGMRQQSEPLRGLYPGQAGRKTDRPSAELILAVFATISVSIVSVNGQVHALLCELTPLQRRLLELLDLPLDLYETVLLGFPQSTLHTSEP